MVGRGFVNMVGVRIVPATHGALVVNSLNISMAIALGTVVLSFVITRVQGLRM